MQIFGTLEGIPQVAARLDKMQQAIAGPIARAGLTRGGRILQDQAIANVHKRTGTLASDIIVKVVLFKENLYSYALIGPGWDPQQYRRATMGRGARSREVFADQTTNPGIYGYFLEVGHRAPGKGLAHDLDYKRAARNLRKRGRLLNTYTQPSSRDYGHLSTPPYPWLEPAAVQSGTAAVAAMSEEIQVELIGQFVLRSA